MQRVEIERWLLDQIALRTGSRPSGSIRDATFEQLGLDSVASVELAAELSALLATDLPETLLFEHPTLGELTEALADTSPGDAEGATPKAQRRHDEPAAVVGIALRLPGATTTDEYWDLLASGSEAVSPPPSGRFDGSIENETWLRGCYVDGVDEFDPLFFGIPPREASELDPQHRLLLELSWEAIDRAGYTLDEIRRARIGAFIGIATQDYALGRAASSVPLNRFATTGASSAMASNRISYCLNLTGPSITTDTACSSGLVALHLACSSLSSGECDAALVGAVNLMLWPETAAAMAESGLLSSQGHSCAFDARADGFVRGEGGGVVLLRRQADAEAHSDAILGLVRGTAVNSDGRTNGILAPSLSSQTSVVEEACARAGVAPGALGYVEAHATGSRLADAMEARALGALLARGRPLDSPCPIGSVKGNIGHLEAASGIAGLAKLIVSARNDALPPTVNFEIPNPDIPFESLPLLVQDELSPWSANGGSRVAGVSAFGFGGTNAHAVLEL